MHNFDSEESAGVAQACVPIVGTSAKLEDQDARIRFREFIKSTWTDFSRSGWKFACAVAIVKAEELWSDWGFKSLAHWGAADLGIKASTISRYAKAGAFLASLTEEDRSRWLSLPVFTSLEVMPMIECGDMDRAYEIAATADSVHDVRKRMRDWDPSGEKLEPICTISLKVSRERQREWVEMLNILRVTLGAGGSAYPADDEIAMAIITTVKQEFEQVCPNEYIDQVYQGLVKCINCGSYAKLQRHHVIPRSHGGKDINGDEVLAWLCAGCHQQVTENIGGGWRALAKKLGVVPPDGIVDDAA